MHGFGRYYFQMRSMSGYIVAENRAYCTFRIFTMSKILIKSSYRFSKNILSASSATITFNWFKTRYYCLNQSRTRPGVPTTISTPCRSSKDWSLTALPPMMVKTRRSLASREASVAIWVASSRVGSRMRA